MGTGAEHPDNGIIQAVLTCQGDIQDPDFPSKCQQIFDRLRQLLENDRLDVTKCEPWNSVKVTFNIPKDAAEKLAHLAEVGDDSLRELGILSLQVEEGKIISMTLVQDESGSDEESDTKAADQRKKPVLNKDVSVKQEPGVSDAKSAAPKDQTLFKVSSPGRASAASAAAGGSHSLSFPSLIHSAAAQQQQQQAVSSRDGGGHVGMASANNVAAAALLMKNPAAAASLLSPAEQSVLANYTGGAGHLLKKENLLASIMSSSRSAGAKGEQQQAGGISPLLVNLLQKEGEGDPPPKKPRKHLKSKHDEAHSPAENTVSPSLSAGATSGLYPFGKSGSSTGGGGGGGFSLHPLSTTTGAASRGAASGSQTSSSSLDSSVVRTINCGSAMRLASLPGVSLTAVSARNTQQQPPSQSQSRSKAVSSGGSTTGQRQAGTGGALMPPPSSVTLSPVPRTNSVGSGQTGSAPEPRTAETSDSKTNPVRSLDISVKGKQRPLLINPVTGQFEAGQSGESSSEGEAEQDHNRSHQGEDRLSSEPEIDSEQQQQQGDGGGGGGSKGRHKSDSSSPPVTSTSHSDVNNPLKLKLRVPTANPPNNSLKKLKDGVAPHKTKNSVLKKVSESQGGEPKGLKIKIVLGKDKTIKVAENNVDGHPESEEFSQSDGSVNFSEQSPSEKPNTSAQPDLKTKVKIKPIDSKSSTIDEIVNPLKDEPKGHTFNNVSSSLVSEVTVNHVSVDDSAHVNLKRQKKSLKKDKAGKASSDRLAVWTESLAKHGQSKEDSGAGTKETKTWDEVLESRLYPNSVMHSSHANMSFKQSEKVLENQTDQGGESENSNSVRGNCEPEEPHLNWAGPGRDQPEPGPGHAHPPLQHRESPTESPVALSQGTSEKGAGQLSLSALDVLEGRPPTAEDPTSPAGCPGGHQPSQDHTGHQGEDSGIESMDALSEKSPNQGESPFHAASESSGDIGGRTPTYSSSMGPNCGKLSPPVSDSGSSDSAVTVPSTDSSTPLSIPHAVHTSQDTVTSQSLAFDALLPADNKTVGANADDKSKTPSDVQAAERLKPDPASSSSDEALGTASAAKAKVEAPEGESHKSKDLALQDSDTPNDDKRLLTETVSSSAKVPSTTAGCSAAVVHSTNETVGSNLSRTVVNLDVSTTSSSTISSLDGHTFDTPVLVPGEITETPSPESELTPEPSNLIEDDPNTLNIIKSSHNPTESSCLPKEVPVSEPATSNSITTTDLPVSSSSANTSSVSTPSCSGQTSVTSLSSVSVASTLTTPSSSSVPEPSSVGSVETTTTVTDALTNGSNGGPHPAAAMTSEVESEASNCVSKSTDESAAQGAPSASFDSDKSSPATAEPAPVASASQVQNNDNSPPTYNCENDKQQESGSKQLPTPPCDDVAAVAQNETSQEDKAGDNSELTPANCMHDYASPFKSSHPFCEIASNNVNSSSDTSDSKKETVTDTTSQEPALKKATTLLPRRTVLDSSSEAGVSGLVQAVDSVSRPEPEPGPVTRPAIAPGIQMRSALSVPPGTKMVPVKLVTVQGAGNVRMLRVSPVKTSVEGATSLASGLPSRTVVIKSSVLKAVSAASLGGNAGLVRLPNPNNLCDNAIKQEPSQQQDGASLVSSASIVSLEGSTVLSGVSLLKKSQQQQQLRTKGEAEDKPALPPTIQLPTEPLPQAAVDPACQIKAGSITFQKRTSSELDQPSAAARALPPLSIDVSCPGQANDSESMPSPARKGARPGVRHSPSPGPVDRASQRKLSSESLPNSVGPSPATSPGDQGGKRAAGRSARQVKKASASAGDVNEFEGGSLLRPLLAKEEAPSSPTSMECSATAALSLPSVTPGKRKRRDTGSSIQSDKSDKSDMSALSIQSEPAAKRPREEVLSRGRKSSVSPGPKENMRKDCSSPSAKKAETKNRPKSAEDKGKEPKGKTKEDKPKSKAEKIQDSSKATATGEKNGKKAGGGPKSQAGDKAKAGKTSLLANSVKPATAKPTAKSAAAAKKTALSLVRKMTPKKKPEDAGAATSTKKAGKTVTAAAAGKDQAAGKTPQAGTTKITDNSRRVSTRNKKNDDGGSSTTGAEAKRRRGNVKTQEGT